MTFNFTGFKSEILKEFEEINDIQQGHVTKEMAETYIDSTEKNSIISKMFEGTNGRIEFETTEQEVSSEGRLRKLIGILNSIYSVTSYPVDNIAISTKQSIARIGKGISDKGQIITKNVKSPYNGMKINKFLIQMAHVESYEQNGIDDFNKEIGKEISPETIGYSKKDSKIKLVFSIRHSDFYAMSLGNSWTSCQSPDGEYSSGAPAWGTGDDSIIVFIESKNKHEKIWRTLVGINEEGFVIGKHYPQDSSHYQKEIANILEAVLVEQGLCSEKLVPREQVIVIDPVYCQIGYNDMTRHEEYNTGYLIDSGADKIELVTQRFAVCSECKCTTSEIVSDFDDHGDDTRHLCEDCLPKYCPWCDEAIDEVYGGIVPVRYSGRHDGYEEFCLDCAEEEAVKSIKHNCYIRKLRAKAIYGENGELVDYTFDN